jgi:enolase
MKLTKLSADKILNSKAIWTVEVAVELEDGSTGIASVPEGLSKGATEAVYLSADDSVEIINNKLSKSLKNIDVSDLELFDQKLIEIDGTDNKSNLGANTTLAISIASARAFANSQKIELYQHINRFIPVEIGNRFPELMVLVIEGGKHADNELQIQEFLAVVETVEKGREIYLKVLEEVGKLGYSTNVGAEGAVCPTQILAEEAVRIIEKFHDKISLDVAASSVFEATKEFKHLSNGHKFFSVEDPFPEDAWDEWTKYLEENPNQMLVADDIVTTNAELIRRGIEKHIANAVIIKPNQIGTITESIRAVNVARNAGWKIICSHRGGETNDDFIADFAVAVVSDYVKFGGFNRGERIAKYNRLLAIKRRISVEK